MQEQEAPRFGQSRLEVQEREAPCCGESRLEVQEQEAPLLRRESAGGAGTRSPLLLSTAAAAGTLNEHAALCCNCPTLSMTHLCMRMDDSCHSSQPFAQPRSHGSSSNSWLDGNHLARRAASRQCGWLELAPLVSSTDGVQRRSAYVPYRGASESGSRQEGVSVRWLQYPLPAVAPRDMSRPSRLLCF